MQNEYDENREVNVVHGAAVFALMAIVFLVVAFFFTLVAIAMTNPFLNH